MNIVSKTVRALLLATPLVLSGCIFLTAAQLQSLKLLLESGEVLPAGKFTEVYSSIHPMELKLKNNWVKVQGQLGIDNPSNLPSNIQLEIVSVDSKTEVALCAEIVKKKGDASKNGSCTIGGGGSGSSGGNIVTVQMGLLPRCSGSGGHFEEIV